MEKSDKIYNNMHQFQKDSLTYGVAVIIPAIFGVISISIYTRIFSAEQFGVYNMMLTTTTFITTLFCQWIQQSIQRYMPEYRENLREFNGNILFLSILIVILISLIGIIFMPFNEYISSYVPYYFISVVFIISQFVYLLLSTYSQSLFKSGAYKNINLINGLLKFAFPILLIYLVDFNVRSIFWGIILSQLLLIVPLMKISSLKFTDIKSIQIDKFTHFTKQFIFYGFPMIGWFLGNSVINLCDRYVIQWYSSSRDVGIYSANYSIVVSCLSLLTSPLLLAAQPILMNQENIHRDVEKIEETMKQFSNLFLVVSLPILAYVICFNYEVSSFLLGAKVNSGARIIPYLFGGILLWDLALFGHKGFELLKKTKVMFYLVLICSILNVILNLLLVPTYNYFGSSVATLISMGAYPILVYVVSRKTEIRWKIDWKSLAYILISSIALVIVAEITKKIIPFGSYYFLELLFCGLISFTVYGMLIFRFGIINLNRKGRKR